MDALDTSPDSDTPELLASNVQEIYFSPATWAQGVAFYQAVLNESPDPAGPPTAVFRSKQGFEIRVTQTSDSNTLISQAARAVPFLAVSTPESVTGALRDAQRLGAAIIIEPLNVSAFPVFTRPPMLRRLVLGIVRFQPGPQARPDDTIVGAIHNPNW